ncbi:MAG: hypothetical protein ACFFE4_08180 [Candidatus Thorarchaeota archaeon]
MSITNELVNRYPWLPSLKQFYSEISEKPPIDFVSEVFTKDFGSLIKERLLKLFEAAFNNREDIPDYKSDKLNIYVYLLLKIFIYVFNDRIFANRLANLYSKITYNDLLNENDDSILYHICEDLGLEIKYYDPPISFGKKIVKNQQELLEANFTIHFIDYLRLASNLRDEWRRLANNSLQDGFVYIKNERLIRLMQEYVRNKLVINEIEDKASIDQFINRVSEIPEFKEIFDKIKKDWDERKEEFDDKIKINIERTKDFLKLFPPCINEIRKKAEQGQNLNHNERLFIVWFLLALDFPVERIVDVFSTLPDFDREKTLYQVNFAKRKKYVPYKCLTLKSLNLCMAHKDKLCSEGYGPDDLTEKWKIAHPLAYVRVKNKRFAEFRVNEKEKIEKKNE